MPTPTPANRDNNFDFLRFSPPRWWYSVTATASPGRRTRAVAPVQWQLRLGGHRRARVLRHERLPDRRLRLNSRSVLDFAAKRALRIMPALIVSVLFVVLVIGPLATRLPLGEYFSAPGTFAYLSNAALITEFRLPGVFASNPSGHGQRLAVDAALRGADVCHRGNAWPAQGIRSQHGADQPAADGRHAFLADPTLRGAERPAVQGHPTGGVLLCRSGLLPVSPANPVELEARHADGGRQPDLRARRPVGVRPRADAPYLTLYLAHLRIPRLAGFGKAGDFSYGLYIFAFRSSS